MRKIENMSMRERAHMCSSMIKSLARDISNERRYPKCLRCSNYIECDDSFNCSDNGLCPDDNLWIAIVERHIYDLVTNAKALRLEKERAKVFFLTGEHEPFCEDLGINPNYVISLLNKVKIL
jgi:hypothetical protein